MTLRTLLALALALVLMSAAPVVAQAAVNDLVAARIDAFDNALIGVMKQGPALGAKGRYRKLEPVVEDAFDLPLMTRFAVGPAWSAMSDADHQGLIRAFTRLTAASYAHNFDRYAGERFDIGQVQTRGPDKIVQAHLIAAGHAAVALIYRMRASGDGWKIVDVYYDGISQLTTRRSDFAAPLAAGGAKGLTAHLDEASAKLLQ